MREHAKQSRHGDGPLEAFWGALAARGQSWRRSYPRVHAAVSVCVAATPLGPIDVISNDLSRYGMQIRCDRATVARMCPHSGNGGEEPTYPMSLRLRVADLSLRVNTHARIVHLTLVDDAPPAQEVALGVEFVRFEDGGEKVLQRFVEQHLRPAGT